MIRRLLIYNHFKCLQRRIIKMTSNKSKLINILEKRGFIHQCTDKENLDKIIHEKKVSVYSGFDATASSLHVGHLLPIMILRWVQKTNNQPIVLLGGGTTKIGDPSGKDKSRKILDDETINDNINSIKSIFSKFLDFSDEKNRALLVNNEDWLKELNYIEFLRDIGKHFSVNRMLSMDSVKLRLERQQPLSFLEFNYMVLQAYDFFQLNKNFNCTLQIGGSDQWGNIVTGVDLGRRLSKVDLFGLTCPLLTTSSGQKMGKTENGAVWLDSKKLSPFDYYQFWRNTEDPDVEKFLKLFTELPLDEIEKLSILKGKDINEAKMVLAFECTKILHGNEIALKAQDTAIKTYNKKGLGSELPTINIYTKNFISGYSIIDALTSSLELLEPENDSKSGLCKSKGEARRLVRQGGARLNNIKIMDEKYELSKEDFTNSEAKISCGTKKHAKIVLN